MKIIIPMAGRGTRLRPHTLHLAKPLMPIAGKAIVERLVEDLCRMMPEPVDEIAYIIGDFGQETELMLKEIAENQGATSSIYYQLEALGTAHAIACAAASMSGRVLVAFADTLFRAHFSIPEALDGVIFVKQVEDPSAFGVVKYNEKEIITDFVEKPEHFVSDLAIIGIYYFKSGEILMNEIQYLLDNNIREKGEFQLTTALHNLKEKGLSFGIGKVEDWLDCGNKEAVLDTNGRYLRIMEEEGRAAGIHSTARLENVQIIEPVSIDAHVHIQNSVIGPNVSIGKNCHILDSRIKNSVIQNDTNIEGAHWDGALIGRKIIYKKPAESLSLGDFSQIQ